MASLLTLARALADPTRLRILALLRLDASAPRQGGAELAIGEIARVLGQSQPRISRHVRILDEAGLVARRREGSWQFVMLADTEVVGHLLSVAGAAGQGDAVEALVVARDRRRLMLLRAERNAQARALLTARAPKLDAVRVLHAPEPVVEAMIRRMLGGRPVGRLVDVGTGTGQIAAILAPGAASVVGIDRSPDMLRVARARLAALPVPAQLMQGDATALPIDAASIDTVVLHQLLHFLPEPAAAIAEGARILVPGGRMLIVDFASHALDRLRHDAGHARLGFSDDQITVWCAAAGLVVTDTRTLPGSALTITLWLAGRPAEQPTAADAPASRIAA